MACSSSFFDALRLDLLNWPPYSRVQFDNTVAFRLDRLGILLWWRKWRWPKLCIAQSSAAPRLACEIVRRNGVGPYSYSTSEINRSKFVILPQQNNYVHTWNLSCEEQMQRYEKQLYKHHWNRPILRPHVDNIVMLGSSECGRGWVGPVLSTSR